MWQFLWKSVAEDLNIRSIDWLKDELGISDQVDNRVRGQKKILLIETENNMLKNLKSLHVEIWKVEWRNGIANNR